MQPVLITFDNEICLVNIKMKSNNILARFITWECGRDAPSKKEKQTSQHFFYGDS